jgi:hypothetical protein
MYVEGARQEEEEVVVDVVVDAWSPSEERA